MAMMLDLKKQDLIAFGGLVILGIIFWYIQTSILLNGDVSWDLLASQRLLAGGSYSHDFFDLNPPLIFFLYFPAIFIAKIFSISLFFALPVYIFCLALGSLWLCYRLLEHIFCKEHPFFILTLLFSLGIIYLILPGMDLAEREHILVILTFPYFLMVSLRLQNKPVSYKYALGIGILAFLGFALKPFFLVALALVELYMMIRQHNLFSWMRLEVGIISLLLVLYTILIIIKYPDYLTKVVPLAQHYYYQGFNSPWYELMYNQLIFFCFGTIILFCLRYKKNPYQSFLGVLMAAMLGFILSYLWQRNSWSYHVYPALAVALFVAVIEFGLMMNRQLIHRIPLFSILAAIFFCIPLSYMLSKYSIDIEYKNGQKALIGFLKQYAYQQPVYFISSSPQEIFPSVSLAEAHFASRLLHLFWIPAVVKKNLLKKPLTKEEITFINMVAEDIEKNKAKYIFVDVKEHKTYLGSYFFDYIPYLSRSPHFQKAFSTYHYVTTLEGPKPKLLEPWSLYKMKNKQSIHPTDISGNALILVGQGADVVAYYVADQKLVRKSNKLFYSKIHLSPAELALLADSEGKIPHKKPKYAPIKALMTRAVQLPAYKYAVYKRDDVKGVL